MNASLADETIASDALLRQWNTLEAQLHQTRTLGAQILGFALHLHLPT